MDTLYTLEDAMNYLKIKYSSMLRLVKNGKIKSHKVGRQYRIKESDLLDFLDAQSVMVTSNDDKNKERG